MAGSRREIISPRNVNESGQGAIMDNIVHVELLVENCNIPRNGTVHNSAYYYTACLIYDLLQSIQHYLFVNSCRNISLLMF